MEDIPTPIRRTLDLETNPPHVACASIFRGIPGKQQTPSIFFWPTLDLFVAGGAIHRVNGDPIDGRSGHLFFYQPGDVVEATISEPGVVIYTVSLKFTHSRSHHPVRSETYVSQKRYNIRKLPPLANGLILPEVSVVERGQFMPLFLRVIRNWKTDVPGRKLIAQAALLEIVGELLGVSNKFYPRARAGSSDQVIIDRSKMNQAVEYLRANFSRNLGIHEVAAAVDMSREHFTRLFRKYVGETPHRFLLRCRIAQANILLMETNLRIKEIASHVGFTSANYFSTAYRHEQGISPRQFRASLSIPFDSRQ